MSNSTKGIHNRAYAVVVGGGTAGLGALRALGDQNVPIAHADWEWNPDVFSVHVRRRQRLTDPRLNESGFVNNLCRFGQTFPTKPVLFPCSDWAVWYVTKNKSTLERQFHIPLSGFEITERILSKDRLYRFLESEGYPTPKTIYPSNGANAKLDSGIGYPCIVKPSQSHVFQKIFGKKAIVVRSDSELRTALSDFQRFDLVPCVQEIVPGNASSVVSLGSYFDRNSIPRGILTTRRIRAFPLSFGTGSRVVSEHLPRVAELAIRIAKSLSFHGIADIDFIEDRRDGKLKLVDFNPRCFGEVYLSAKTGSNIPLIAYFDMLGGTLGNASQVDGIVWVDNVYDLLAFYEECRIGKESLSAFLRQFSPSLVYSTLTVKDPFPTFQQLWLSISRFRRWKRKKLQLDRDIRPDSRSTQMSSRTS